MSQTKPNNVRAKITPHLICADSASAIEFYKKAFGAEEALRLPGPDGKMMHACIVINDSPVMLADETPMCDSKGPKALGATPVTIHLYVDDVDALYAQAMNAGAKSILEPQDMFWGDRYGIVEDPEGHRWSMATHVRDVPPEKLADAAREAMSKS